MTTCEAADPISGYRNAQGKEVLMSRDDIENTGEMSEVDIDATLADSFPASDPPSWTLGIDHRDYRRGESSEPQSEPPEVALTRRQLAATPQS
jgi:hypothetical protein